MALQAQPFTISGTLRDGQSGEAMPFANCVLLHENSTFARLGATTGLSGAFRIGQATDTAYLLRITAVGYEPHWQHLHLPQDTALGTISLFRSSTTLDEVAVTAEKPLYSADGEKTFYHAEDDPACRPAPPAPSSTSLPTAVCNSTSYSP
ncbi:MAG: carboxypeptidase regulatory-like domain-containing protein [Bacteroidales bacterium]|nr:carboxypeptidase regulatory-like domain-containing protein [Bacteroidales bacterium]